MEYKQNIKQRLVIERWRALSVFFAFEKGDNCCNYK